MGKRMLLNVIAEFVTDALNNRLGQCSVSRSVGVMSKPDTRDEQH